MLYQNFVEQDGFWFTSNQINSYGDFKKRMKIEGSDDYQKGTMMLFVVDEKSALLWLHNFLNEPRDFSDISTAFTKLSNIHGDIVPDLKVLLEENFVRENGNFRRPKKLDKSILENSSELNDFVEAAEIMVQGIS